MAFGFPASFTASINTFAPPDATRTAIIGAFQALGWKYTVLGPERCEASVPVNILSWGEVLTVELTSANTVTITSRCRGIQVVDWGKNRQNVNQFLSHFSQHATHAARLTQNQHGSTGEGSQSRVDNLIREGGNDHRS
jgi:hypothetical protein